MTPTSKFDSDVSSNDDYDDIFKHVMEEFNLWEDEIHIMELIGSHLVEKTGMKNQMLAQKEMVLMNCCFERLSRKGKCLTMGGFRATLSYNEIREEIKEEAGKARELKLKGKMEEVKRGKENGEGNTATAPKRLQARKSRKIRRQRLKSPTANQTNSANSKSPKSQ